MPLDPTTHRPGGLDLLLTHGYFLAEDPHEREVMMPYPPLGLLSVSAYLKEKGFRVEIHDSTFSSLAELEARIVESRPAVLGVYTTLLTRSATLAIVEIGRREGCVVVLGGPEPGPHADEYLERGADVVVVGEGELTMEELLRELPSRGPTDLESVAGIAFRDGAGTVVKTPPRARIPSLDELPWPDREAISIERYLDVWRRHHGYGSVSLITARGCPYTCTWCSHAVFGRSHRRRSVDGVVAEVEHIRERYAPERLWYADDVFTIDKRWTLAFAAALAERHLALPFECISRADRIDAEVADALASMGCRRLWIGAESGSQRILDAMRRRTSVDDVVAKTGMLRERGIEVGTFIMLGYEGEELEDLEATAAFLERAAPDVFLTTVAYPIRGTPYYDEVADRLVAPAGWSERTDRQLGVSGRHSRRYYEHATRWLVNRVNLTLGKRRGDLDLFRRARMTLGAARGRLGMRLAAGEREGAGGASPGGRGWAEVEASARRGAG